MRLVSACGVYFAVSLAYTWPLPLHLGTRVPHDLGDPLLNTFILWWNAQTLPFTAAWWNPPFFHPTAGVLALSETLLGLTWLTTPLQWLTGNPLLAHNVAYVASFPLSGVAAHLLVRRLTGSDGAALVAGIVYAFNPHRAAHLAQLQVQAQWWAPLVLFALHAYGDTRHTKWLILFGAAWFLQVATHGYLLFYLPIVIVLWLAWFAREWPLRALAGLAGAWLAVMLPLVPLLIGYREVHQQLNLHRTLADTVRFSADAMSVFWASSELAFWPWSVAADSNKLLFPGAVALVLAAAAVWMGMRRKLPPPAPWRWRLVRAATGLAALCAAVGMVGWITGPQRVSFGALTLTSTRPYKPLSIAAGFLAIALLSTTRFRDAWRRRSVPAFYLVTAAVLYVLSLGPEGRLLGRLVLYHPPYRWLMQLPGFNELRVPALLGMPFVLCLSVVAGLTFQRLAARHGPRTRRAALAVVVAVALVEGWIRLPLAAAPHTIGALRRPADRLVPVLEIPAGSWSVDTPAMHRAIDHRRPVINGYSGYSPPDYGRRLIPAIRRGDETILAWLTRTGAVDVVVDMSTEAGRAWDAILLRRADARHTASQDGVRVYRVSGPKFVSYRSTNSSHVYE